MIDSADLIEKARAAGADILRERPFEAMRSGHAFAPLMRDVSAFLADRNFQLDNEGERPLTDVARFGGAVWIIYLEATPGGLTHQRLDHVLNDLEVGGMGRARAVLIYLSYNRLIEPIPPDGGGGDGRHRRYRTTTNAQRFFRRRLRDECLVRQSLDPALMRLSERLDEPDLLDAFVVAASEISFALLKGQAGSRNPVNNFGERNRGISLLYQLLFQAEAEDSFPPRGPLAYSVRDLARRCDASRMQITHLLGKARQQGLLITRPDGREALSEKMITGVEMMVASTSLLLVASARLALDHADAKRA